MPAKKNCCFPDFLTPALPLARGGPRGLGRLGKRNIGATLDRLVGGVQCGQWSQQQGGEGRKGVF